MGSAQGPLRRHPRRGEAVNARISDRIMILGAVCRVTRVHADGFLAENDAGTTYAVRYDSRGYTATWYAGALSRAAAVTP